MTEERKIMSETVDAVVKPAKARVNPADIGAAQIEAGHAPAPALPEAPPETAPEAPPESATDKLERKRDYLAGFLSEKPANLPSSAPGGDLHDAIVERLKGIFDPEIPVNIYDLGLIYGVDVSENGDALVTMTLTTPHCPVAESMPAEVEMQVMSVPGVAHAEVNLVWDPAWDPQKMSDDAKLELGML